MIHLAQGASQHFIDWKIALALSSCAVLGLRHGFDYDHLAAISDITAVQRTWREGMRLGLTYALGHAFTVVALGVAVIMLHLPLPARLDAWTERLIGVTLIVLAALVVGNLFQKRHTHHGFESRIALLVSAMQQISWRVRRIFQRDAVRPAQFRWNYSGKSVFFIGILHGLGAETPSQLMLFLLAASLGGTGRGLLGLLAFAIGLVVMNGVMTATLGGVYKATAGESNKRPAIFRWVAVAGAVYSFVVGVIFLLGASGVLPPLG
jgi:high-affinity nickel-transport protein